MRTTEQDSLHNNLDKMSTMELLHGMNTEDLKVAEAVQQKIDSISSFVDALVPRMKLGGRLFYIGAGTSGRLGIVDASECPPTFGVDHNTVIGVIAGGDSAIRKAVENAEDSISGAWEDLESHGICQMDTVVGIAASGTTPYVIGGVSRAKQEGLLTACITCNTGSPLAEAVDHPIEVVVGPEFVTGSTRMKAGTAQKLVLNMISTATMIKLGRVRGNKMVDMQLSNDKLVDRGTLMIQKEVDVDYSTAQTALLKYGSVRLAIDHLKKEQHG